MLPKYHIIIGLIASIAIYLIFNLTIFQASIIFLSSFLIDADHYLLYIFRKKDFSLINSIKYFKERRRRWLSMRPEKRKHHKRAIFIFHGIEFWILLIIIANYINLIWFVLLGIFIHMILDYIDLIYVNDSLYTKLSQLYVYYTNKGKKDFL